MPALTPFLPAPSPLLVKDGERVPASVMDFTFNIATKDITEDGQFEGYASVFDLVDQGGDCVKAGAFIESIKSAKDTGRLIPMLWQHNRAQPIGKWLDLAEDARGLYVKGQLLKDAVAMAAEAYALLKAAAIGGLSIGYRTFPGSVEEDPKRRGVYLLKKIDLVEVSLVTLPMLIQARVTALKHMCDAGQVPTVRQFEEALGELGFSKSLRTAIAAKAAPLLRGEPEAEALTSQDRFFAALDAGLKGLGGNG